MSTLQPGHPGVGVAFRERGRAGFLTNSTTLLTHENPVCTVSM